MNQNYFYWAFTPLKVIIYQSIHTSNLMGFWRTSRNVSSLFLNKPSSQGFLWSSFFCLMFLNGIQPFARFTAYRIYSHWNWFVLWWRTLGSKIKFADFWLFFYMIASKWQFLVDILNRRRRRVQILVSSSDVGCVLLMLKHWTYFQTLINFKTRNKICFTIWFQLLTNFSECFATCSWKFY